MTEKTKQNEKRNNNNIDILSGRAGLHEGKKTTIGNYPYALYI
jgi:hypothetical protein